MRVFIITTPYSTVQYTSLAVTHTSSLANLTITMDVTKNLTYRIYRVYFSNKIKI